MDFSLGGSTVSRFGDLRAMLMEPDMLIATREVLVSNSELKLLNAVPKELVPAQGANKLIEFVSAVVRLNAGASVLTESSDNLVVRYTNGFGVSVSQVLQSTGFIDQAVDMISEMLPKVDPTVSEANALNKALVLHNSGNNEFGGNATNDATLELVVNYRVHELD